MTLGTGRPPQANSMPPLMHREPKSGFDVSVNGQTAVPPQPVLGKSP